MRDANNALNVIAAGWLALSVVGSMLIALAERGMRARRPLRQRENPFDAVARLEREREPERPYETAYETQREVCHHSR